MLKDLVGFLPDIKKRLLVVFTHKAEKSDEDCQVIITSFIAKAKEIIGFDCNHVCVDSEWYQHAISQEKISEQLVEQSGINEIKKWISKSRKMVSPSEILLTNAKKSYISALSKQIKIKEKELIQIKKKSDEFEEKISKKIERSISKLTDLWKKCNEQKLNIKELKNEIKDLDD